MHFSSFTDSLVVFFAIIMLFSYLYYQLLDSYLFSNWSNSYSYNLSKICGYSIILSVFHICGSCQMANCYV